MDRYRHTDIASTSDYRLFLASKAQLGGDHGFAPENLPDFLFPFQSALVEWATRKGRAAIFADCGLGKSAMQLAWADQVVRRTRRPVLILTPLAVAQQTVREAERFGFDAARSERGEIPAPITVTNYERLKCFSPADWGGVVCDECFPVGTEIDTPKGRRPIETLRVGDRILNASGVDRISDVHRREVAHAVRVTVDGDTIISSPNHPYFTRRGWVAAQDLIPSDEILATSASMRMVRSNLHGPVRADGEDAILRAILLSEMADESAGECGEAPYTGSCEDARRLSPRMAGVGIAASAGGTRTYPQSQSDKRPGGTGEDLPPIESHEPRTFRAWGQRAWFDAATTDHAGCAGTELGNGMVHFVGSTDSRLSDALQARLGRSRAENRYRGGWELASQSEASGREEGRDARFARVDGLEVLEPGHPDLERLRDADGKLYFYDLGGTQHPSFSVHGLLVHNSSILKNFSGAYKAAITEFMRRLPYRLLATATAAPNDYHELGTSSEALGYLGYMDMLGRFFTNTQKTTHGYHGKYRIEGAHEFRFKGHAEEPFWRWVASWARATRKPSDLGFDDTGFLLPPITYNEHVIDPRTARPDSLFDIPARGFREEQEERRRTIPERCEYAASLVTDTGQPAVIWCHLNDEGDTLARLIPDAVQVSGADSDDAKERKLTGFTNGDVRVLITKPKIGAWGLNWQHCNHVVTFPSHSWEQFYQATRRCWRFGQERPVTVDIVASRGEAGVQANLQRKAEQADRMFAALTQHMQQAMSVDRGVAFSRQMETPAWL